MNFDFNILVLSKGFTNCLVGTTFFGFICLLIYQIFCLNSFMRSFCSLPLSCVTSPHCNLLVDYFAFLITSQFLCTVGKLVRDVV